MADLPAELLIRLKRRVGNRCGYCRMSVLITGPPLTIEHIIPLARGGSTTLHQSWVPCS
jgi:5-methylcytosine-specific restriction endonuclease McrA